MRSPKDFFRPLAVGAPEPLRDIPFRPFTDDSTSSRPPPDKMVAKLPDIAARADVVLGNLEDAIPASRRRTPGPGW
jgi:malyl-CoA/(S)-citramalyl-CoA lyase